MSAPMPIDPGVSPQAPSSQQRTFAMADLQELVSFAARGLVAMFDEGRQLFCHRLLSTKEGLVREGDSPRYTLMTLLGLKELESTGAGSPFDIPTIYGGFARDANWVQGVGDIGLLLWVTATFEPDHLGNLLRKFEFDNGLDGFSDAREGSTVELSWFLSGLAHAAEASPILVDSLTDLAVDAYRRIEENRGQHGFYGHMGEKNSLSGRLRGRIGSFADQVYPIYAMSKFARAFHIEDPLGPALECAKAICGAQGKLGQWWWLYDARSGRVSSRYPVYSVHQHGMAPMCLTAVEEATGQSFREYINRGLRWIYGANELGVDMRDGERSVIWRCIRPGSWKTKYWEMAMNALGGTSQDREVPSLHVLCEQRPYEFGWLLFAFARSCQSRQLLNGPK